MYLVTCLDHENSEALRLENRPAHLEYVRSRPDAVSVAGPITSEDGKTMIGSVLLLTVDSRAEVQDFIDNDPYNKAGLFAETRIHRFNHVLGSLADPQG